MAREWRCKWSGDNEKVGGIIRYMSFDVFCLIQASLNAAQKALEEALPKVKSAAPACLFQVFRALA